MPPAAPLVFKLNRSEATRLRSLFAQRNSLQKSLDAKEFSWNRYYELQAELDEQVSAITQIVGARTIGELPLTLRELDWTSESPRKPVVIFQFRVIEWGGRLQWRAEGVALRKDGSVGENISGISLDEFPLARRHVDGSWAPLIPRRVC